MKVPRYLLSGLLSAMALSSHAEAQEFQRYDGAVSLYVQQWQQTRPDEAGIVAPTYQNKYFLKHSIQRAWGTSKGQVEEIIKSTIGAPNAVRTGQTLYDLSVTLAEIENIEIATISPEENGPVLVGRAPSDDVIFRCELQGNKISGKSTQSLVGKWGDPKFDIFFDMSIFLRLRVPSSNGPITAHSAQAKISNTKVHTTNAAAEVGEFMGPFMEFFGGTNYPRKTEQALNKVDWDITDMLEGQMQLLNGMLKTWGFKGYRSTAATVAPSENGPELSIVMSKTGPIATTGPGMITGTISWPIALGNPIPNGPAIHPVAMWAKVPAGPRSDPNPRTADAGVWSNLSAVYAHNGKYNINYGFSNLPVNVPIQLSVKLKNGLNWTGAMPGTTAYATPDGWSGEITILPPLPFSKMGVRDVQATQNTQATKITPSIGNPPNRLTSPGEAVANNAQPAPATPAKMPPKMPRIRRIDPKNPGGAVTINPQPLPPKINQMPAPRSFEKPIRNNPTGHFKVIDIDFQVAFSRGLQ